MFISFLVLNSITLYFYLASNTTAVYQDRQNILVVACIPGQRVGDNHDEADTRPGNLNLYLLTVPVPFLDCSSIRLRTRKFLCRSQAVQ